MSEQTLVFDDPAWVEVPVKIGTKDYLLREASEGVTARYRDAKLSTARIEKDGITGFVSALAPSVLVAGCLFEVGEKGKHVPVTLEFVRGLRPQIVKSLCDKIRAISPGLDLDTEKTDEEAKKEPTAAGTSS